MNTAPERHGGSLLFSVRIEKKRVENLPQVLSYYHKAHCFISRWLDEGCCAQSVLWLLVKQRMSLSLVFTLVLLLFNQGYLTLCVSVFF